jgi:BirA family biotin operon repressor/biotin-[acetyl-CoA-carboxylase] ligase
MDRLSWIPLAAAVGVCRAIREQLPGAEPRIKWPNDIWWSGAKAGGILCEGSSNAHGPFVIVGLGLNCVDFPRGVPAASIPANVSELRPKIIHHALAAIDSLFDFSPSERGPTDAIVPAALSQEYESVALLSPGTRVAWGSGEGPVPGLKTGRGLTGTVLRVGSRGELWVLPDPVSGTPPAEATALYAEDVRIRDLPEASAKSPA